MEEDRIVLFLWQCGTSLPLVDSNFRSPICKTVGQDNPFYKPFPLPNEFESGKVERDDTDTLDRTGLFHFCECGPLPASGRFKRHKSSPHDSAGIHSFCKTVHLQVPSERRSKVRRDGRDTLERPGLFHVCQHGPGPCL